MAIVTCPICEKKFDSDQVRSMPFCSRRCQQIDMNRWRHEDYGLPYESEQQPLDRLDDDTTGMNN